MEGREGVPNKSVRWEEKERRGETAGKGMAKRTLEASMNYVNPEGHTSQKHRTQVSRNRWSSLDPTHGTRHHSKNEDERRYYENQAHEGEISQERQTKSFAIYCVTDVD